MEIKHQPPPIPRYKTAISLADLIHSKKIRVGARATGIVTDDLTGRESYNRPRTDGIITYIHPEGRYVLLSTDHYVTAFHPMSVYVHKEG